MTYTAAVITVSDSTSMGQRTDTSGPAICSMLKEAGYSVVHTAIVPDDIPAIRAELTACADEKQLDLIITTGGTVLFHDAQPRRQLIRHLHRRQFKFFERRRFGQRQSGQQRQLLRQVGKTQVLQVASRQRMLLQQPKKRRAADIFIVYYASLNSIFFNIPIW